MENRNIDKDLKNMFHQFQPELDYDDIWENIEPRLKKKKKRRFFFLWFLMGGLALASYFVLIKKSSMFLQTEGNSSINTIVKSTDNKGDTTDLALHSAANEAMKNEANLGQKNNRIDYSESSSVKQINNSKRSNKAIAKTNANHPIAHPDQQPFDQVYTLDSKLNSANIISDNNKNTILYNDTNTALALLPIFKEVSKETNSNQTENTIVNTPYTDNIEEVKTQSAKAEEPVSEEQNFTKEKNTDAKISKEKKKSSVSNKKKKRKKRTRPVRKSPWELQAQTTVAPMLAFKSLKLNNNTTESRSLLEQQKAADTQLEAFSFNIGTHFQHKRSGLVIAAALEYRQINERFHHFSEEIESFTGTGAVAVTENFDGAIINTETGPKAITTTTTIEKKIYNHHRFISIPIGVGKAWSNRKNGCKLLGGLDINLAYRFEGAIYNQVLDPVNLATDKNTEIYNKVFKSNSGIGLWFSGEYNRAINPRLNWVIAPKLQLPLTSTTKANYSLLQKHFAVQLDLGVNYLLNPTKKKSKGK